MTDDNDNKDYCDAEEQKKVVEKMTDCDKTSESDKAKGECYSKVVKEDGGCMSS